MATTQRGKLQIVAEKFRRAVITQPGGPEVLHIQEEELVAPAVGEVRIRVQAAGVAYGDVIAREGLSDADLIPYTPGYDAVGVVDALGPEVRGFEVGQTVAALMDYGGYTESWIVPADQCAAVPQGIDPVEAVSMTLNGLTAYQMLHRMAQVQRGERVLVHGAGGGVGTLLLQLGKIVGLEMVGTASQAKHAQIREMGATPVDYRATDYDRHLSELGGEGFDAVFDGIGGASWGRSFASLRPGGRLVIYGRMSALQNGRHNDTRLQAFRDEIPAFNAMDLFGGAKAVIGYYVTLFNRQRPDWFRTDLETLFDLVRSGMLTPLVGARFSLDEVPQAHETINRAGVTGKIVLVM